MNNSFTRKIHYILWVDRSRGHYTIEEYVIYKNELGLKEVKTFYNKYELRLYLAIKGIKFNNFKIYYYLTARMINFYDE